jgi:flagellar motor switch protein FliM
MARNVTEQELDALLARSDAPRPEVQSRDFDEPRWLSADDLDQLQRMARTGAAAALDAIRSALPLDLELGAVEVSESSLDAHRRDARAESTSLVCESPAGPSLATIDRASLLSLADAALGAGDASSIAARELSPLEASIAERLLTQAFARMAQAFGLSAKESRLVSDAADLSRALRADGDRRRVAVLVEITRGDDKLVLHFLLAGVTPAPRKPAPSTREKIAPRPSLPLDIASTRVEIAAVLGELEIMLTDLLALEAGDLIPLALAPGDAITLRIEGEACGRARFGERDGRMAVRLTEILRPVPNR